VYSGSRVGGTTKDYKIQLQTAPSQVVYIDLASSSIVGYLLQIDEFECDGTTSSGVGYWRFPTELTTTRQAPYPDQLLQPRALNSLTIHWRNPNGSVIAGTIAEHTIELDIWERIGLSGL